MATTAWSGAPARVPRRSHERSPWTAVAVVTAVLLAELVLAAIIAVPRLTPLLLMLGALGAAVITLRFPLLLVPVLLVISASVLHPRYFPEVSQVRVHEALVLGLLAVAAIRPRRKTWGGASGGALLGFFLLLGLTQVLAALDGRVALIEAANWTRPLLLVALFWVVIRLVPDRRTLERIVLIGAVIAGLTSVLSVSAATGGVAGELFQDLGRQYVSDGTGLGLGVLERVRFPGIALCYGLFWPLAVLALRSRGITRWSRAGLLGLMVVCLGLTLWRNVWLGVIGGFFLLFFFSDIGIRTRMVKVVSLGFVVVLVLLLGAGAALSTGRNSVLRPVAERATTLFVSPTSIGSKEKNLQSRAVETRYALGTIEGNLLTGIGGGVPYGMWFKEARSSDRWIRVPQKFLHNQWLWLVLVGGIPLMLLWGGFLVSSLRMAWTRPRDPLLSALGVGLAMIMISGLVELFFSTEGMTLTIGLLTGLIHVARQTADAEHNVA